MQARRNRKDTLEVRENLAHLKQETASSQALGPQRGGKNVDAPLTKTRKLSLRSWFRVLHTLLVAPEASSRVESNHYPRSDNATGI